MAIRLLVFLFSMVEIFFFKFVLQKNEVKFQQIKLKALNWFFSRSLDFLRTFTGRILRGILEAELNQMFVDFYFLLRGL